MKRSQLKLLSIISLFFLFACGDDDGASPRLTVNIEDQFVNLPSNVSVFFRVDDGAGNGVAGLTESDFTIYENGSEISEFEATRKIQPTEKVFDYHITLMLDLSGSVLQGESLSSLKDAAKGFIDEVIPSESDVNAQAVKMEIWWFDGAANVKQLQGTATNAGTLKASIDGITPEMSSDNSTNLYGAVIQGIDIASTKLSQTRQQDEIASSALVIFTDGTDQANRNTRGQAAGAVKNADKDLALYTIGLGGEIDETILREIGKTSFVSAANIGELLDRFKEIGDLISGRANSYYLLEYCSPKRSGSNQLTIEVNQGALIGSANTFFDASDFNGSCVLQ